MRNTSTKTHISDSSKCVEDFSNSPHVVRAIEKGQLTLCGIITDRIVDELSDATCIGCLNEKCKSTSLAEIIESLNSAVHRGALKSYRFEGTNLYIEPVSSVEHITISTILDKNVLNGLDNENRKLGSSV
jgi:hypothetical protein